MRACPALKSLTFDDDYSHSWSRLPALRLLSHLENLELFSILPSRHRFALCSEVKHLTRLASLTLCVDDPTDLQEHLQQLAVSSLQQFRCIIDAEQ